MYSDELLKIFKNSKIEVGDRIKIESKEYSAEGELMPKAEVSAEDIIIVKLDSGYNIGMAYGKEVSLKKIAQGKKSIAFPKAAVVASKSLPKVSIIYTGGTIGSKIDYITGGAHTLIDPSELLYEVPELAGIANVTMRHLFSVWSEDMTYMEWQAMAKQVKSELDSGAHGVVITMGTDMMHYTAAALSFMLEKLNAPVVVTGAQRSSDRGSSDAFINLSCAVQIAARSDIAEVGICMHASSSDDKCAFIRGTRARKMHTSRRDAFRPINDKAIAYVDRKMNITYNNDYNRIMEEFSGKVNARTGFEPKVALLKSFPNSDPEVIDFYVKKGYKGIIIEGTGLGNLPGGRTHEQFSWLDKLDSAVKKGVVVGLTSQCMYGRVSKNVYSKMREISALGVIYCEDMTAEAAYVKLGWLLGNYKPEEAKALLDKSIAREIKERSNYDEFLI